MRSPVPARAITHAEVATVSIMKESTMPKRRTYDIYDIPKDFECTHLGSSGKCAITNSKCLGPRCRMITLET